MVEAKVSEWGVKLTKNHDFINDKRFNDDYSFTLVSPGLDF